MTIENRRAEVDAMLRKPDAWLTVKWANRTPMVKLHFRQFQPIPWLDASE
jgi:hypothetical protein